MVCASDLMPPSNRITALGNSRAVEESDKPLWTFLTNHSHVLICIADDVNARFRDVAARVGITERSVQRIVGELCDAGYLAKVREGRRNRYTIHLDGPLRHPLEGHCTAFQLLDGAGLVPSASAPRRSTSAQ